MCIIHATVVRGVSNVQVEATSVNKEQEVRGASTNITEAAMLSATGVHCKEGGRTAC